MTATMDEPVTKNPGGAARARRRRGPARRRLRDRRLALRHPAAGEDPARAGPARAAGRGRRGDCWPTSPGGSRPASSRTPARLDEERRELDDYFAGRRHAFELPIDWQLSHGFLLRARQGIAAIPYGETRTYTDLARAAGNERAVRAAGSACSRNPIPLVVPCHRVLRSDGSLGGYAGGLEMKERAAGARAGALDPGPDGRAALDRGSKAPRPTVHSGRGTRRTVDAGAHEALLPPADDPCPARRARRCPRSPRQPRPSRRPRPPPPPCSARRPPRRREAEAEEEAKKPKTKAKKSNSKSKKKSCSKNANRRRTNSNSKTRPKKRNSKKKSRNAKRKPRRRPRAAARPSSAPPKSAVVERAESTIQTLPDTDRVRLTVHYKDYSTGAVAIGLKLKDHKGSLALEHTTKHLGHDGALHLTTKLGETEMERAEDAREFDVALRAPGTPGYCGDMLEQHLKTAAPPAAHGSSAHGPRGSSARRPKAEAPLQP